MILAAVVLAVQSVASPSPSPSAALDAIIAEVWESRLREDPLLATAVGDRRFDDRLPSMAWIDVDRRNSYNLAILQRLMAVDRAGLSPADRINRDMLDRELRDAIADHRFGGWRMPWNADSGFHTALAQMPSQVPLATARDYDNYVARLRAMPEYMRQQIHLLRDGLTSGFVLPRAVLEGFDGTIRAHVVDDPAASVFYAPFPRIPAGVSAKDRARLREAGLAAVREAAIPAYRELLDFYLREYLPAARPTTSAADLPRGREYYAWRVRSFTTLEVTPDEVHQTGLAEVARIRAEMEGIGERHEVGGRRKPERLAIAHLAGEPDGAGRAAEIAAGEGDDLSPGFA